MRSRTSFRDFALAAFVVAAIAGIQAAGVSIPASRVYGFGANTFGSLGIGSNSSPTSSLGVPPTGVIAKERLTNVDGGGGTSIGVSSNGSVYTWGLGYNNGLGYPVTAVGSSPPMERTPRQVPAAFNAFPVSVSAGSDHMLAAFDNGKVWSWGSSNTYGQLGHPISGAPGMVGVLANVRKVSAGGAFSLAVDDTGQLWGWGLNTSRQLGTPGIFMTPVAIAGLPVLQDVSAGSAHTIALAADGTVWAWGQNTIGQAGQPPASFVDPAAVPGLANIVAIAAGSAASFALAADGTVWGWGLEGDLGVNSGAMVESHVPRAVLTMVNGIMQPLTGVRSIAAGDGFALAALADGRFAVWGARPQRTLGFSSSTTGFPIAVIQPALDAPVHAVAAGALHGFALTGDPPITTAWQPAASVSCGNITPVTLALDGYSVAGGSKADIMLVLDESGSITSTQFSQLKTFATNFVRALDVGPDASRVGVVMFSTDARLILHPSDSQATILNAIAGINQRQGYTCISCGLDTADASLDAHPRAGATRYMVVVTDGVHNLPNYSSSQLAQMLNTSVANAKTQSTLISVGIGSSINVPQLTLIASSIAGATTVFTTPDFDSLEDLIQQLAGGFSNPGTTNARLDVDLGPQWRLVSSVPSSNTSSVNVTGPHSFTWSVPELDASGAALQLQVQALAGGTQPLPASQQYQDDQNNTFEPGAPRAINVVGCPAALTLSPAASSGEINTNHTFSATLVDHFDTPIPGVAIRFDVVGGGPVATLGTTLTDALGVAAMTYTSPVAAVHTVQASLDGDPSFVSNTVTRSWTLPNAAPVVTSAARTVHLNGSPVASVTLDAGEFVTDDGQPGAISYSWNGGAFGAPFFTAALGRGVHQFQLQATDSLLTSNVGTVTVTVVDPTPPVVTPLVTGTAGSAGWYTSDVAVSWTIADPESVGPTTNGCSAVSITVDTPGQSITCTALNDEMAETIVTVSVKRDATPPVVSASPDITASATSPTGAIVTFADPSAVDAMSGLAGSAACQPASGSTFAKGTTHVICSATDSAGNIGTAGFDVTVADTTPPSIVAVVSGTPGSNGWFTSPVQIVWTVSDPQSSVTASGCDPVTLSADTPGVTITCSASSDGGSSSASESVKIDQAPPAVTTPGDMAVTTASLTGAAVSYAVSASDAMSGLAGGVSCAPASGSTFPTGTTTVQCTAADHAGNVASAAFVVTVTFGSNEPGRMHGDGHVMAGDHKVDFEFNVMESARRGERGRVEIHIRRGRHGRYNDDRFESRQVDEVAFSDAPAYTPGRHSKTGIDTVVFTGTGRWDRHSGYTYVVTASDRGEPGRGIDTFTIEVKAPNGQVVFSGGGAIAGGNVQSNRVKR